MATPQLALSAEPSGDTLRAGQQQAMAREAFGAAQENCALSLAQRALDLTLAYRFDGTHPTWLLDTDGWRLPTDNAWGLSDFSGNFAEGVQVRYGSYPEAATVDPCGPAEGFEHVLRGGSGTVRLHIVRMITP